MRTAGACLVSRSVGRNLCATTSFYLNAIRRAFGVPLLLRGVRGVHRDARMAEPSVPKPTGPSGAPFSEMLEYSVRYQSHPFSPSGVPFIEMLEFLSSARRVL